MKQKLILLLHVLLASSMSSVIAQSFSSDKVYTIVCKPDFNLFMQDKGTGGLLLGNEVSGSLWTFEPTGKADCYYVKNVKTGNYIQACPGTEVPVSMGTSPVEYYIKGDADGGQAGENFYRTTSTDRSPSDFSAGTIGLNRSGANTNVQGFASVVGANPSSVWRILEVPRAEKNSLTSPYTGTEVHEGCVYLYNVESGMWLQNNNRFNADLTSQPWTTRGELGSRGLDFTLIALPDGGYQIGPRYTNNNSMNDDGFYLDTTRDITSWQFTPVVVDGVSNTYRIESGFATLGADVNNYLRAVDLGATTWQVVTLEERLQYVQKNASASNPIDVTFLVNNPDLSNNNERNNWVVAHDGGNEQWNDFSHFNRHCQVQGSGGVDISQTGIEVPNGTYQVLFTAFYAPTALGELNAADLNTYKTDGDAAVFAVGYANDETIKLPSVYSLEATESVTNVNQKQVGEYFFPGNPDQANGSLAYFLYQTELLTVTVTDGLLNIGVRSVDGCPASAWIGLSDVKVYYLGQADENLTLTVDVTESGYATFVAPMEAAVPEGVNAYTAEVNANGVTIDLTPVKPIPANTPVILEAAAGTYTFTGRKVPAEEAPTCGALTGTYSRIPAPDGSYVLQEQAEKVGFYLVDTEVAVPYVNANRAYLTAPQSGAKAFFFGDSANGIQRTDIGQQTTEAAIYNLSGQRLSRMQKGVNIVGGKKILH